MRRLGASLALFISAFAAAYLACCYLIPGWRIKLEAGTAVYFIESVRHMALVKSLISLVVGLGAGAIPILFDKMKTGH